MKFRWVLLSLLFLCMFSLYGGEITGTITFSPSDVEWINENGYVKPHIKGCSYEYSEDLLGNPTTIFKPITVLIPSDAKVTDVRIEVTNTYEFEGEYNILPTQRLRPFAKKEPFPFVEPNSKIYSQTIPYPVSAKGRTHEGYKDGYQLFTFNVYPLQYIPSEKKVILNTNISYTIVYEEGAKSAKVENPRVIEKVKDNIKDLVINPDKVDIWGPKAAKLVSDSIDYVIITPSIWTSYLEPLREWKTKKGTRAVIVTTDDIYLNYAGVDNAEKIRNFIIDANATWGSMYFLLVGQDDSDVDDSGNQESPGTWCPRRDVFITSSGAGYYDDEDTIASDLYYGDLDGTWNADGDNTWGESTDNVDKYTDVYVGRVLAETSSQVTNFVNKIINYEKNLPSGMVEKVLLTSENLFTGYNGELVSDSIAKYDPTYFTEAKCYDEYNDYDDLAAIDSMEVGYMYVHHAGHGDEVGVMYGSYDPITVSDIENYLSNPTNLYGIVIAISCWPGAYDYDSYAEHLQLLTASGVGGVAAAILNYRYGWGTLDNIAHSEWIDIWFFQSIFGTGSFTSEASCIAEALADAKDKSVPYTSSDDIATWCIYELNLYGDPEMPLWTTEPQNLSVTHNSEVSTSDSYFDVAVTDALTGSALSNAKVCLMLVSGGDTLVYARGYTSTSGTISLPINITNALNGDTLFVTVTKKNYYPYEGYAIVTATGISFLKDEVVDTVAGGTIYADNQINPGETVDLNLWIQNNTGSNVTGLTGTLTTTDPNVTIVNGVYSYGTVIDSAYGVFRISVSNTVGDGYTFPCQLICDYTGGTDTLTFNLTTVGISIASTNQSEIVFDYIGGVKNIPSNVTVNIPIKRKEMLSSVSLKPVSLSDYNTSFKAYTDTLMYDDDVAGTHWYGVDYWAVKFAPAQPCSVTTIMWGRYHDQTMEDTIWIKADNSGSPGVSLYSAVATISSTSSDIIYSISPTTPPEIIDTTFWVCIYAATDSATYVQSYFLSDTANSSGLGERSYYSSDGLTWSNMNAGGYYYDLIIRAEVFYYDTVSIVGTDSAMIYVLNTNPNSSADYNVTNVYALNGSPWLVGITPTSGVVPLGDSLGISIVIDTTLIDSTTIQNINDTLLVEDTLVIVTDAQVDGNVTKAVTMQVPVKVLLGTTLSSSDITATATILSNGVLLNWRTIGEEPLYYSIKKKGDGGLFDEIGLMPSGTNEYLDRNAKVGINTYRVDMVYENKVIEGSPITVNYGVVERYLMVQDRGDNVVIKYALPEEGNIDVSIYDKSGRLVKRIYNSSSPAGMNELVWNKKDGSGNAVNRGVYFCIINDGNTKIARKFILAE